MMKPKIVLLIFVSGKIVLTGAKVNFSKTSNGVNANDFLQVREEIYQAFELIYPVLSGQSNVLAKL